MHRKQNERTHLGIEAEAASSTYIVESRVSIVEITIMVWLVLRKN